MAQASFRVDDEFENRVRSRLVPGQAMSIWYRYSAETTMIIDPILDEIYEPYQYDKRQELVEAAVIKEVERRKGEVDNGSNH